MKYLGVFAVLVCLILVGCAPKPTIVGKWKMDTSSMPGAKNDLAAGMAKGLSSMFSFEFKADNTYSGAMMEGTYTVSGNTVTLMTTKVMGMDVSKMGAKSNTAPQTGELSADGKTLTIHTKPSAGSTGSQSDIKLVRDTGQ